jgi:Putative peptidoglycan binding domain
MAWRLAKSLETLRSQINAAFPNRSKTEDGTIGDAAHQAEKSEHNPDKSGVVRAMDITHDPAHGVDTYKLAEWLRTHPDPRILYVISNGRIWSSQVSPYKWRAYNGSNKHDRHVHVSVVADPKLYDDMRSWNIGQDIEGQDPVVPDTPATPAEKPTLKQGDRGPAVVELQRLLPPDGIFGPMTAAAVKAFQSANGLEPDGVVGPATWTKLTAATAPTPPPTDEKVFHGITATVFGGASDVNRSAYTNKLLNDTDLYVALPYRFRDAVRPKVKVTNPKTGVSAIAPIEDVGPWNTSDPYWLDGARPQAESGTDRTGRKTNLAGIDLSPALAKRLGISGKGVVDWSFA